MLSGQLAGRRSFPANRQINILFSDAGITRSQVMIHHLSGRKFFDRQYEGRLNLTIPVSGPGTYIVKVQHAKGILTRKVWIYD